MPPTIRRPARVLALAAATLLGLLPAAAAAAPRRPAVAAVRVPAVSDFHGNLEPPLGSSGRVDTPTLTLTGDQIHRLLEQQWVNQPEPRFLQVSAGFSYTWDAAAPVGSRVDPASITLDGTSISPTANDRVTVNSFRAGGGDAFTVLTEGRNLLGGPQDVAAFTAYLTAHPNLAPPAPTRIRRLH